MRSPKFRFGLLTSLSVLTALVTLGCLTWYELSRPLYTGLSRLQHEISQNPQIYGRKAYMMSVYISHVLYGVACMLIVIAAPFALVLGALICIFTGGARRPTHHTALLIATLVAHVFILFAANALLIGAATSALSTLITTWRLSDDPATALSSQRASLNEDLHLLVTRAKFRNAQAVQLMDDIHTLFNCCGVRGAADWVKPPYQQTKTPKSCDRGAAGCTQTILRAVAKHRMLAALASICLLVTLVPTQWTCIMLIGNILVRNAKKTRDKTINKKKNAQLV